MYGTYGHRRGAYRARPRAVAVAATPDSAPVWLVPMLAFLVTAAVLMAGAIAIAYAEEAHQQQADRTRAAIAMRELKVREHPRDVGALLELERAYRSSGLLSKALETNERILAIDARNTAALYNIGRIHEELGDEKAAEVAYWDVLEIDPGDPLAAKALGELYIRRGHYRSLLVAVRPAAAANPDDGELAYLQAIGDEKAGRFKAARDGYWKAMTLAPRLTGAREGYLRVRDLVP